MNKNLITWLVVIALVVVGVIVYMKNMDTAVDPNQINTENPSLNNPGETNTGTESPAPGVTAPSVKSFTVTASNYSFAPALMTVNEGDTVRITFINDSGQHDWKLDEFGAATSILNAGESETIEFVADKAGGYEYYCSVGQHRAMGMKGTLIVQ